MSVGIVYVVHDVFTVSVCLKQSAHDQDYQQVGEDQQLAQDQ